MKNTIFKRSALTSAILFNLGSVQAANIAVDSNCSLIDAIQAANTDAVVNDCPAGSGADVIEVIAENSNLPLFGQFNMTGLGLPAIESNITIEGNGLTINANTNTENFGIFLVQPSGDLSLRNTNVTNGDNGGGYGSGLFAYGRVTIENSTFTGNNGAIFIVGSSGNIINDSVISNNVIKNTEVAAGIQVIQGGLEISNSSITGNRIDFNESPLRGGGVTSAGGLSLFQSEAVVTNNTISGNKAYIGGGVSISGSTSTSAPFGGKIQSMIKAGSGIDMTNVTLTNNTITENFAYNAVGGLLDTIPEGTITLQGNIISGNSDGSYGIDNVFSYGLATLNLDGHNIIGDQGDTKSYGITLGASDMTFSNSASENLFPLIRSNGQLVHPLKPDSVAIDGMPVSCFGLTTDQEGKGRGIDGDNDGNFVCDIGALENAKPIVVNDAPCDLVNAVNSANADASVGGCQPGNGHDIIVLEENSLHSLDVASYVLSAGSGYNFGLPAVTTGITLAGNGSTIEKANSFVDLMDIVIIPVGGGLTFSDVTLTKANSIAAVFTQGGDVTLMNAKVIGNQAIGFAAVGGKSAVINSTISNNNNLGTLFDTTGSGMVVSDSDGFKMKNSTVSNNISGQNTGLAVLNSSGVEILNSTISGNTATINGAYEDGGTVLANGSAGGIGVVSSNVVLTGLTVTNNSAEILAAGLVVSGTGTTDFVTQVRRSIISGNEGTSNPLITAQSVESNNISGLLYPNGPSNDQSISQLNRGILVDEVIATSETAIIEVDANNIFGQSGSSGTAGFTVGASDVVPDGASSTVIEGVLANNGGSTLTHNPVTGSVAIDVGALCFEATDQTGNIRNWDTTNNSEQFGSCDVGAVEFQSIGTNDIIFKDGFDEGGMVSNVD